MTNTKEYIGEIRKNNFGTPMKIIDARKKSDIDVQFLDEHGYIKKHCNYQLFKKGEVKNPYDKTVFGVAHLGIGKYMARESNKRMSPAYDIWHNVLKRCYARQHKEMFPVYYGICTVCDEWLNFQNFANWYYSNRYKIEGRLHLDKDILHPGNTIYSPENCLLVPQRINMLFVRHRPNKFGLPEGIGKTDSGRFSTSYNGKSYGTYITYEEAIEKYVEIKSKTIKEIAEAYKNIVPMKVYNALMNYKVIVDKVA